MHQAQTCAEIVSGTADIIFNKAATGDGKSLGAYLPSLLNSGFRIMGLYPTIELVEDQAEQLHRYHNLFGLDARSRIDRLFGEELSRRAKTADSNKFQELLRAIYHQPILLTNPDIFHLITHYQYRNPAYGNDLLPLALAEWPDLWVFDEFPIFGPHQEAAVLNSMTLIRRTQQRPRRFLFTSATPKPEFIELLRRSGLDVVEISGVYADGETPGYRCILQPVELELIALEEEVVSWLTQFAPQIREILEAEVAGRGLIILNSVALAGRVTRQLQELLPGVAVREVSGRIDRQTRSGIQAELKDAPQPVLVVGTSAVDVGVDFRIHLLICESSDSATVLQRLGRLGRHPGFSAYKAFLLIPSHTPWIMAKLEEKLKSEREVSRGTLNEVISDAFNPPREFQEYRQCWGPLQAQGMFWRLSQENADITKDIRDRMSADLQRVYGSQLESARKKCFAIDRSPVGKEIRKELLRFRGSSALQAAVWDDSRFYSYDLLRLIPYATLEVIDRETFLSAAAKAGRDEEAFPDRYIQVYLKIAQWADIRFDISLHCNRSSKELKVGELSLVDKLSLVGHPQSDVVTCLVGKKLLAFLVPVNKRKPNSHWDVSHALNLSPLFGLYRLTDADLQPYACAFNQDALLLKALDYRLKKFYRFESSIF